MLWIPFTLFAAFMQAWRNALQKQLSQDLGATSVTLARFILAGPLAALYLGALYLWSPLEPLPHFSWRFSIYIVGAAACQIVATALMVRLFQLRNYAVGVGLAKSEAIWAAVLGTLFFGSLLTPLGWLGVIIGGVAVALLSGLRNIHGAMSPNTLLLGIASGLTFALTSLWVREASLLLELSFPFSAAWVLALVVSLQTLVLVAWLGLKEPASLVGLARRPTLTALISLCSCLGSIGWFSAMSLESVALVKTLGQVEVLFTLLISSYYFKAKLARQDHWGLVLIVLAALCVMWA
ncbi:DMT family transporter [Oceanisphaera avium]|uniref:Multidrug transporter n=1 Tax=Oceanisphaera avium TaxID=1903694 RepID=A0A1Y0CX69_9GAMM|nr:DMT family transporter [Oceanisphaera avium]ART79497.1 multidrug transporter [Oceanisphaera avium]